MRRLPNETYFKQKGLPHPKALVSFNPNLNDVPRLFEGNWWLCFEHPTFLQIARALYRGETAAFDLDGTVWHHDAEVTFVEAFLNGMPQWRATRLKLARRQLETDLAKGRCTEKAFWTAYKKLFFTGERRSLLVHLAERIWWSGVPSIQGGVPLLNNIYPEMLYLINLAAASHQNSVAIVSASPSWALEPVYWFLGVERSRIFTRDLKLHDGMLEEAIERDVYGSGKAEVVREVFPQGLAYAFGDSPDNDGDFFRLAQQKAVGIGPKMSAWKASSHAPEKLFVWDALALS